MLSVRNLQTFFTISNPGSLFSYLFFGQRFRMCTQSRHVSVFFVEGCLSHVFMFMHMAGGQPFSLGGKGNRVLLSRLSVCQPIRFQHGHMTAKVTLRADRLDSETGPVVQIYLVQLKQKTPCTVFASPFSRLLIKISNRQWNEGSVIKCRKK